jgi:hypothetical protein
MVVRQTTPLKLFFGAPSMEAFSVKTIGTGVKKSASTVGKGVVKGSTAAGKGVAKGAGAAGGFVKNTVFGPIWRFIKSLGFYLYCCCCLCCCCSLWPTGIIQAIAKWAMRMTPGYG